MPFHVGHNPANNLIRWWEDDLSDIHHARQIIKAVQPNVIFHLTTYGVGAPNLENVIPTLQNDLVATVNMLTLTAESNVERLLLAASLEEPQPGVFRRSLRLHMQRQSGLQARMPKCFTFSTKRL